MGIARPPRHLYEFGPFRLDPVERNLTAGDRSVPLQPRLADTLVLLVENSGHVLAKEELMRALWPDTFVEESSLAQNISQLRKALGDSGTEPRYIETVPKRGYRFLADVRRISPDPAPQQAEAAPAAEGSAAASGRRPLRRWLALGLAGGALVLAASPFAAMRLMRSSSTVRGSFQTMRFAKL